MEHGRYTGGLRSVTRFTAADKGQATALNGVMLIRFLLAAFGALFLASIAAFFLFVPLLSIATVASMVVALMVMFGLGVQFGTKGSVPAEVVAK
jgi:fatty acid desaturase